MITKRIIPCLDVKNGRVVKGVNFEGLGDVSCPVELARHYSECGADELVFYDITASFEGRALFTDILCRASDVMTPDGGIRRYAYACRFQRPTRPLSWCSSANPK